jgi:hypothetical protein
MALTRHTGPLSRHASIPASHPPRIPRRAAACAQSPVVQGGGSCRAAAFAVADHQVADAPGDAGAAGIEGRGRAGVADAARGGGLDLEGPKFSVSPHGLAAQAAFGAGDRDGEAGGQALAGGFPADQRGDLAARAAGHRAADAMRPGGPFLCSRRSSHGFGFGGLFEQQFKRRFGTGVRSWKGQRGKGAKQEAHSDVSHGYLSVAASLFDNVLMCESKKKSTIRCGDSAPLAFDYAIAA